MDAFIASYGPGFGFTAFVMLVLVSVVRGDFVPRRSHESRIADKDKEIERAYLIVDQWRDAYNTTAEAVRTMTDSMKDVVEHTKSTEHVMQALVGIVDQAEAGGAK